jgi:hypothetical protein
VLKDIIDAGGPGLLIPAVLFLLILYVTRGLFGLHGRKGQHRREFLELWDPARATDDLWLEVAVRHQFGTFLPAPVIRIALQHPATSQSLIDLSELWPLLHYDASARTVRWRKARYAQLHRSKRARLWPFIAYFVLAGLACFSAWIAYGADQSMFIRWSYSVLAIILAGAAFVQLGRDDAFKIAAESGSEWIQRINHGRIDRGSTTDQADVMEERIEET